VDVRVIATSSRPLKNEVEAGRFRGDLYFRLNVMPIGTPPLRERLEDLPLLVERFVERAAAKIGIQPPLVRPDALTELRARPWPGNIRELENVIERAVILCKDGVLSSGSFESGAPPPGPAPATASGTNPAATADLPEPTREEATFNLDVLERIAIRRALEATGGHRTKAAQLLGISERTLRNKLKL
jgi:two-component system response regulator PilR (NtrC family)